MSSERLQRGHEPWLRALVRNAALAVLVGVAIAIVRRAPRFVLTGTFVALWPSLGGHFLEVAFLNGLRPRLPGARLVQAAARLAWWLAGGALLAGAMIATARLLPIAAPAWQRWWIGGPVFVALELVVHATLALRGRPSFYRGDG